MKYIFLVFILFSNLLDAQLKKGNFMLNGYNIPYRIIYPKNFSDKKQYPLMIFLHSSKDRGNDNQKQLNIGKEFFEKLAANDVIVLIPQCPEEDYWSNVKINELESKKEIEFGYFDQPTHAMKTLIALIKHYFSNKYINLSKIYIGGIEMGGAGTFELLWRMPHTFVSAFSIGGGGEEKKTSAYANHTAVWIFHRESDYFPVWGSIRMYLALKERNADVKYTEYSKENYSMILNDNLVFWLLSY